MRTRGTMAFLVSVAAVALMILCAATQLMGTFCFHKATRMGHERGISLKAMESARWIQPSHSLYWFLIGREMQGRSEDTRLTFMARRDLLIEAEKYLGRAIALEPSASLYHYHQGWIYAALSPHWPVLQKRAHVAFSRATSLNPTNAKFRRGVADYYLNQYALHLEGDGRTDLDANVEQDRRTFQGHFRAFLEIQPNFDPSPVLERCFAITQEYEDLKGVIPDQSSRHLQFARFLDRKGMWNNARTEFESTISQNPKNLVAYHAYASALFAHDFHEEALAVWKKQQAMSPHDPRSYRALSKAFWILRRKEEAVAELEHLVAIHPHEPSYRLELAAKIGRAGNPKRALELCQDVLEMDPKNPKTYVHMANHWIGQGDLAKAEASLRRAVSLNPSVISYRHRLARLYFGQKRYARAIEEWQNVLKLDREYFHALKGIGESYERLDDWDRALLYYRQALAIKSDDQLLFETIQRLKKNMAIAG